jgi:hypothetical protein
LKVVVRLNFQRRTTLLEFVYDVGICEEDMFVLTNYNFQRRTKLSNSNVVRSCWNSNFNFQRRTTLLELFVYDVGICEEDMFLLTNYNFQPRTKLSNSNVVQSCQIPTSYFVRSFVVYEVVVRRWNCCWYFYTT